jgi:phosphoribosylformylglycinamidine (FGAM) synthase-like enzyme
MSMQIEGVVSFLVDLKIPLSGIREVMGQGGVTSPELFIKLQAPMSEFYPPPFPGFRMSGECLYVVGMKPTFMDCGSRVLSHLSRVESNHISPIDFKVFQELYTLMLEVQKKGWITSLRPVYEGGVAAALAEMMLWSRMGAQIRPGLTPIELFSAAPGRFVVGILPAEVSRFESMVKSEWLIPLGISGGEKLLGLTLERLQAARTGTRAI